MKYLTLASLLLIGCQTVERDVENFPQLNIYQPPILSLGAGKTIETKEGFYTPQTDEVWHSDSRYRKLERESYH